MLVDSASVMMTMIMKIDNDDDDAVMTACLS